MENDIWSKSWQSFEHNFPRGPLNAVGPFAQPSIFLKRALKVVHYDAERNQLCEDLKKKFF